MEEIDGECSSSAVFHVLRSDIRPFPNMRWLRFSCFIIMTVR